MASSVARCSASAALRRPLRPLIPAALLAPCLAYSPRCRWVETALRSGLFLEELRARGWLLDTPSQNAQSSATTPPKRLFLVPAVPVPPYVNASVRMLLSLGLQEAVLKSVRANPPPPGSTGPNHFLIVARVCSCFISGDRRPHLGKRARDECMPFQRIGPTKGELTGGVRVLSWEQVTPLDRKWSASPSAAQRLPNLVVPYPSSLLGEDRGRGRHAPWVLPSLRKPVRVFAAFGMLSNLTRAEIAELYAGFATHCAPREQTMIAQSSCYGKKCRFALRALMMKQLERARVPASQRHRERACLREGRQCPEVMSLVFWAFHDGGEGVGRLSDHHKSRDEPLYVDDREANDVLAVYRVMLSSTFCVHVGGDTPTRKSFVDAILAVCIPVVFQDDAVLFDSLPYADVIPYHQMVVHAPIMSELTQAAQAGTLIAAARASSTEKAPKGGEGRRPGDLLAFLRAIPPSVIEEKRRLLRKYAPLLTYPYPKMIAQKGTADAMPRGANAVTMAVERLAADVAAAPV